MQSVQGLPYVGCAVRGVGQGREAGPAYGGLCQSAWLLAYRQHLQRLSGKERVQGDVKLGKELVAVRMMGLGRGEAGRGKAG